MNAEIDEFLDRLCLHEKEIAALYRIYADRLPEARSFWETLVMEEQAHMEVLRQLQHVLRADRINIDTRRFPMAAINTSMESIRRRQRDTLAGHVSLLQALAAAADIETAMLERDFFKVFSPGLEKMRAEFVALAEHTADHARRIRIEIEKLRSKGTPS